MTWRPSALVRSTLPLLFAVVAGCGSSSTDPTRDDLDFSGSWNPSTNFGGPWGHDRMPVESAHFRVYSGYASQEARRYTSSVAEESLSEILDYFAITETAFDFLPRHADGKVHVLAIKDQDFGNNNGFAYRDGLVVISRESPNYARFGFSEARYKGLIKHETTHVVEFLLIGDPARQQASDAWWREGFANYLSGPRSTSITSTQQLEAWRSSHAQLAGGGNPIAIHSFADFPEEVVDGGKIGTYYDVFELAVRYLLDPDGGGTTPQDVVALYDALGEGFEFRQAAQAHLGISLGEYEAGFWDLMLAFLDPGAP
ncbi:MAG: hypothetical protein R2909_17200 [Gemmatimonadales bacterium]